jgi:hypothetical protein
VTPGTPQFKLVRPGDNIERIDSILQIRYRSIMGKFLFLIKHSRPDLANVVRELSKCMDGASTAAYKEMLRIVNLFWTQNFIVCKCNLNMMKVIQFGFLL